MTFRCSFVKKERCWDKHPLVKWWRKNLNEALMRTACSFVKGKQWADVKSLADPYKPRLTGWAGQTRDSTQVAELCKEVPAQKVYSCNSSHRRKIRRLDLNVHLNEITTC